MRDTARLVSRLGVALSLLLLVGCAQVEAPPSLAERGEELGLARRRCNSCHPDHFGWLAEQ